MPRYSIDDRVRIDIPDTTDPDFDEFHGCEAVIVDVIEDDAGMETGDARDSRLYRLELEDGTVGDFRARDLRPPFEEE